jgi:putative toxin-antitoxin system antitoxin component (TIGR02293 family)
MGILPDLRAAVAPLAKLVAEKLELGADIQSDSDLATAVLHRLPLDALEGLAGAGFSESEIGSYVIPPRTRRHRAARKEPLTVEESDRAVRLARLQSFAEGVFGDPNKANLWLRRGLRELGGESPLSFARAEAGARLVETILGKIAWGAAA